MEIKKAGVSDRISVLVYGPSGIGKTTLGGTMPKPVIFLDCEGGTRTVAGSGADVVSVATYDDLVNAYQTIKKEGHWNSVVIDSLTELQWLLMQHKMGKRTMAQLQDWGGTAEEMHRVIVTFRSLPSHLLMTAMCKERVESEIGPSVHRPDLPGQLERRVPGFVDVVAHMEINGNARKLRVQPSATVLAKIRAWGVPDLLEPHFDSLLKVFATNGGSVGP